MRIARRGFVPLEAWLWKVSFVDVFCGRNAGTVVLKNKRRFFLQTAVFSCTVICAGGLAQLVRASA